MISAPMPPVDPNRSPIDPSRCWIEVPMSEILNGIATDVARKAMDGKPNPFDAFNEKQLDQIAYALCGAIREKSVFHNHKLMVELFGMVQLEQSRRTDWKQELDDKLRSDMQSERAARED